MQCLLAYDANGDIVATFDHLVAHDDSGKVIGLVDFAAHEANGGEHTDIWSVSNATGSKVWPEWLGGRASEFRVELEGSAGNKTIAALVHRVSGHRRARAEVEAAIAAVPIVAGARDIRHVVGGPQRPLQLDEQGRTAQRSARGIPRRLPLIGR